MCNGTLSHLTGSEAYVPPQSWDYHQGNWTYVETLGFPLNISRGHIEIGQNWTYIFTLDNDSQYHVYFYGEWLGTETDYDIFVYDPQGYLETYHTESHGLIEHLGTTVEQPLFKPKKDGNYSILIVNDPKDSLRAESGTLMVIEHLGVNSWYRNKTYLEVGLPYHTSWVYEFNSSSQHIEIAVDVPDTLDMYEARIYLMANPAVGLGSDLLGIPIAWEPGLYGQIQSGAGGYNTNRTAYRGNAFDSHEYKGQSMLINYTSTYSGNLLYHLVFLAEYGDGNLSFIIQTDFSEPVLNATRPSTAHAGHATHITVIANDTGSGLERIESQYSIDDGNNWTTSELIPVAQSVYKVTIPGQPAGTTVLYSIEAADHAGNTAVEGGSYLSQSPSTLTIALPSPLIDGGSDMNLEGNLTPPTEDEELLIQYFSPGNYTEIRLIRTQAQGYFHDIFTPNVSGTWKIVVAWPGSREYSASQNSTIVTVLQTSHALNISVNSNAVVLEGTLIINGVTSPALPSAPIDLRISNPNGGTSTTKLKTSSEGAFFFSFSPNIKGSWAIEALFQGDLLHNAASASITVDVHEPWPIWYYLLIVAAVSVVLLVVWRKFIHKRKAERPVLRRKRLSFNVRR
jgi:hypothetical protein